MATCLVRTLLPVVTKVKFHRNVLKNPPKLACTKLDTHKPLASQTFNFVSQLCTFAKVCKTGSVTYDEVVEIQEECNPVMIDVRDRHEVEHSGPVPETINIPLQEIGFAMNHLKKEDFRKIYGTDKPDRSNFFVLMCRSGSRAKKAMLKLREAGFERVAFYKGSYEDWQKQPIQRKKIKD